jgi:AcrR family transcriptional regulator
MSTHQAKAPPDTKTALLDAAQRLFASDGIAESSLRAITAEAGANLASVNYHFGSKEGLVRAVFARRLGPLNRRRIELLEGCLAAGGGVADLRCLLTAFVEPAMAMMKSRHAGDREFVRLLSRTLFEPTGELTATVVEEFREVGERFTREIAQSLPAADQEEIVWRFHFMVGALAHTVAGESMVSHRLECLHLNREEDAATITDRLVDFLLGGWGGLQATAPRPQEKKG